MGTPATAAEDCSKSGKKEVSDSMPTIAAAADNKLPGGRSVPALHSCREP